MTTRIDQALRASIDTTLRQAVNSNRFIGLSFVSVSRNGEILYSGAHGHRDFAKTTLMDISTSGFMASMTKLMTSVAVMQVVERGRVGLDDDLGAIVPELGDRMVLIAFDAVSKTPRFEKPREKITLRRLLTHTSGFTYDMNNATLLAWAEANGKDKEIFSGQWKAWERPLVFSPGSGWSYGQGLDWAGKVVEVLTGMKLEDYMQENIWSRVGMSNTTFRPECRDTYPMLEVGFRRNGALVPGQSPFPRPARHDMGGGGIHSNAHDYALFLAALLADDSPLLKCSSIEEFLRPQLGQSSRQELAEKRELGLVQPDIPSSIRVDHCLGGLVNVDAIPGRRSAGSVCWDGMTNSHWSLDRTTGVANALFVQVLPSPDWVTKELWTNLETQVQEYIMQGMGGVEAVPMQPPIPAAVEVKPAFRVLDRPLDVVE